jgi:CBS domain containing-hemolysin-like protein
MAAKKQAPAKDKKTDNLAGIMLTVVSIGLLFLFIFGLLTPRYWALAISIPVGIFTCAVLAAIAVIGWDLAKKQY